MTKIENPPRSYGMQEMDDWGMYCQKCNLRPATENWVGEHGSHAVIRGLIQKWCKRCCLEYQIQYAEKLAAKLPDLRAELTAFDAADRGTK